MKKNIKKYKILVLSDLKNSTATTLKSTVSLAKMINGEINFFHVKKPSDIVEKDNQLSAIRTINQKHNLAKKEIQNLVKPISEDFDVNINSKFTIGNIKSEIGQYIKEYQPDVIVIGKRKSKPLSIIGDNITDFVLKTHQGIIMIAADENSLEPNKKIALGFLNDIEQSFNIDFADDLMAHTHKPLKSFKIVKSSNTLKETSTPTDKNTIEYVFEKNDNAIKNLSNYISKNNINLFCMDRGGLNADNKDTINKLNVSLLLTA